LPADIELVSNSIKIGRHRWKRFRLLVLSMSPFRGLSVCLLDCLSRPGSRIVLKRQKILSRFLLPHIFPELRNFRSHVLSLPRAKVP